MEGAKEEEEAENKVADESKVRRVPQDSDMSIERSGPRSGLAAATANLNK